MKWTAVVVLRGPEGTGADYYSVSVGMLPAQGRQHPLGTRDFVLGVERQWGHSIQYQMFGPRIEPEPKRHWLRRLWDWMRDR